MKKSTQKIEKSFLLINSKKQDFRIEKPFIDEKGNKSFSIDIIKPDIYSNIQSGLTEIIDDYSIYLLKHDPELYNKLIEKLYIKHDFKDIKRTNSHDYSIKDFNFNDIELLNNIIEKGFNSPGFSFEKYEIDGFILKEIKTIDNIDIQNEKDIDIKPEKDEKDIQNEKITNEFFNIDDEKEIKTKNNNKATYTPFINFNIFEKDIEKGADYSNGFVNFYEKGKDIKAVDFKKEHLNEIKIEKIVNTLIYFNGLEYIKDNKKVFVNYIKKYINSNKHDILLIVNRCIKIYNIHNSQFNFVNLNYVLNHEFCLKNDIDYKKDFINKDYKKLREYHDKYIDELKNKINNDINKKIEIDFNEYMFNDYSLKKGDILKVLMNRYNIGHTSIYKIKYIKNIDVNYERFLFLIKWNNMKKQKDIFEKLNISKKGFFKLMKKYNIKLIKKNGVLEID